MSVLLSYWHTVSVTNIVMGCGKQQVKPASFPLELLTVAPQTWTHHLNEDHLAVSEATRDNDVFLATVREKFEC